MIYYILGLAAAIAALHMVAPDHWVPLSALSVRSGYTQRKTLSLSLLIGITHGLATSALSASVAFLGLVFLSGALVRYISFVLLIAVSVYIVANAIREQSAGTEVQQVSLAASVIPDPALVPILLLASPSGLYTLSVAIVVFLAVTVATVVCMVYVSMLGYLRGLSGLRPATVDYIVAAVLAGTALYVLLS
ncbi:hypothetical protein GCM10007108_16040 [Thermogymnomonas acidicola]|uniref:Uncharacterized protein n=1 Tax=Thermogymnomonas acidicola TaxID=399579 RepID=A0AA37F9Z1_9ARCH|nr:hypothetical protein [Thermogymnomonas acidicola]GGM78646.1 hypothetical protein GCM10007108_16040 [Thermogymnomonas acidicola]